MNGQRLLLVLIIAAAVVFLVGGGIIGSIVSADGERACRRAGGAYR